MVVVPAFMDSRHINSHWWFTPTTSLLRGVTSTWSLSPWAVQNHQFYSQITIVLLVKSPCFLTSTHAEVNLPAFVPRSGTTTSAWWKSPFSRQPQRSRAWVERGGYWENLQKWHGLKRKKDPLKMFKSMWAFTRILDFAVIHQKENRGGWSCLVGSFKLIQISRWFNFQEHDMDWNVLHKDTWRFR